MHFSTVQEYVGKLQGTRPVQKILVANNGCAAVKGIRSIRRWAYEHFGNSKAVKFVCMATPEDIKANAEYVILADELVEVPGGASANNYSNIKLIVDIAVKTGADAVWPGWGHSSENPELPTALEKTARKIVFIGPRALPMQILGDKISSSIVAESANVPTLPWSGNGLRCENALDIPEELFDKACVHTLEQAKSAAARVGYPLMVKASEGGGGKGIRRVDDEHELPLLFEQVQAEVPGSPIFLMKLAHDCRHLEVQIVADEYGHAVALYSRDCSVQRRHQKILEEGPVSIAPRSIVEEMEKSAVRLTRSVSYSCAGTVEFLLDKQNNFYFLELNPRLQVEHPVTEWITNTNLPAIQLNIAMGIPLHRIPDIRRFFGQDPFGDTPIDFDSCSPLPPRGHVIAARITAENPEERFQPTSGSIHDLTFRTTPNVWGYFSTRSQGSIHAFADSQFGHIFAFGPNREQARKSLAMALAELNIRGDIRNSSEFLKTLVEHEDYVSNAFTTSWLDTIIQEKPKLKKPNKFITILCGALHTLHNKASTSREKFLWFIERGQRPPDELLRASFPLDLIYENTKYSMVGYFSGLHRFTLAMNSTFMEAEVKVLKDGGLLVLTENGESHIAYAQEEPNGLKVVIDSCVCMFTKEFDPSELRANVPGKVVRFLVPDKSHVAANTPVIALEMMKMIIMFNAQHSGKISFQIVEGSTINQGDLIAIMDLDDKSQIKRALPFDGTFPENFAPGHNIQPNQALHRGLDKLKTMLYGYDLPNSLFTSKLEEAINDIKRIADPDLFVFEFIDHLFPIRNKLPKNFLRDVFSIIQDQFFAENRTVDAATIMQQLRNCVEITKQQLSDENSKDFLKLIAQLVHFLEMHDAGYRKYAVYLIEPILNEYITLEKPFEQLKTQEEVVAMLREKNKDNISRSFDMAFSHARVSRKNAVIRSLLELIESLKLIREIIPVLDKMSEFIASSYSDLILMSKQLLMKQKFPSYEKMRKNIENLFHGAIKAPREKQIELLKEMIDKSNYSFDLLLPFMSHIEPRIRELAAEVYIRKAYITFDVCIMGHTETRDYNAMQWKFISLQSNEPVSPSNAEIMSKKDAIVGSISTDSLNTLDIESDDYIGYGVMAIFDSLEALKSHFAKALNQFSSNEDNLIEQSNVYQIVLRWNDPLVPSDDEFVNMFTQLIDANKTVLKQIEIRRVTILVAANRQSPFYYTFREQNDYLEDPIYRHIEPTLAFQLYLRKLSNYTIKPFLIKNPAIHVYYAEKKKKLGSGKFDSLHRRFFVRTLMLQGDIFTAENPEEEITNQIIEGERYVIDSLNALELAMSDANYPPTYANHIFINLLPEVVGDHNIMPKLFERLQTVLAKRLWKLKISAVEVKLNARLGKNSPSVPLRFIATNTTGYNLNVDIYQERKEHQTGRYKFAILFGDDKSWDGLDVNAPYPLFTAMQEKRRIAHNFDTTYVYDYPTLFEIGLQSVWENYAHARKTRKAIPKDFFKCKELVLDDKKEKLVEKASDEIGNNKFGMIVWRMCFKTPEIPQGREIIVIANDITFQSGSFGPMEDLIFKLGSELSRAEKTPRIYIAANSGARIGIACEVLQVYRVAWNDELDSSKGYKYLYVTEKDYETLSKSNSIIAEPIIDKGEKRYKITDIIGKDDGLGVENLRGSGMIAGETSRAYDEVFTLSYVASRTVGIGAYLVRLGQRVIQHRRVPILLTGAPALNKVLGREVYTSNLQLGGIQIMHTNGVSHLVATDDVKAISLMLRWLSYVPEKTGAPLPIAPPIDPVDRDIDFEILNNQQPNPRHMIAGHFDEATKKFVCGFFDKDSFFETLDGWAKNVVVGRARLGGIPMGIISVECKSIEQVIPADPADSASQERVVQKAGPVWFPDSAYKTAQAIRDFNTEELPLMIFANWRGFSGGQRDMFEEILKFGSFIVDALVAYKRPVFVYIPPFGELRGGAWVVVDPTINENVMEMYADIKSRGGVLEPSGIVEIKYRKEEILGTIHRLDAKIIKLDKEMSQACLDDRQKMKQIETAIRAREKQLLATYLQIAETFCDLHDTPGRMKAKGVVSDIVEWKTARQFFYWRLRRRLAEFELYARMRKTNPQLCKEQMKKLLMDWVKKSLVISSTVFEQVWKNDQKLIQWLNDHEKEMQEYLNIMREECIGESVAKFCEEDAEATVNALINYLTTRCDPEKRSELVASIRDSLNMNLLNPARKRF